MPHDGATVGRLLAAAASRLARAGVPAARQDAAILIGQALGRDRGWVLSHADQAVSPERRGAIDRLLDRRAAREPVSRILGHREFWSLDFALDPATLDPRPDSETLVAAGLALMPEVDRAYGVLDLGTGTGCLLLAVLHERPQAWGVGVDLAPEAVRTAKANARQLGLADRARFLAADWAAALDGRFDLVLCNPPYIRSGEIAQLEPEVARHEPHRALAGGADGLQPYRAILPQLPRLLRPDGHALFEIGDGQTPAVRCLARLSGLQICDIRDDLAGRPRCAVIRLP